MKTALWFAIVLLLILGSYNYGLRIGMMAGQQKAAIYQNLYNQAIQWQTTMPLPHKAPKTQLKEKE